MCIFTITQNVNIWGLPLGFDIVHYLFPMRHVYSNKFQFSFWLSFGSCLCEFGWCGFSIICTSIYYLRNHLFHIILTMALPVGLNSWNYQQTLSKYGVYFLSFAICLFVVKLVLNIIPIYHREISLYTPCPWQVILVIVVDFVDHFHIGSCVKSSYLLPSVFILTPVAFLASCMDPIFQLV